MASGLPTYLAYARGIEDGAVRTVPIDYYTPGYWTMLAAAGKAAGISFQDVVFESATNARYATALRLQNALGEKDDYPFVRHNEGRYYSGLVPLESAETTDAATACVNGCIRHIFADAQLGRFVQDLQEVVGDLHDNVWSHGKSTGFSMAQRWRKTGEDEHWFEFALADRGLGFLRELNRVGIPNISTHADAINWCIQKGNSSKKVKVQDDFTQWLPPDMMGNPIPGVGAIREKENHHMGLGLAKLVSLVERYDGMLWLASGDGLLSMTPEDGVRMIEAPSPYQGVGIAVRFDTGTIRQRLAAGEAEDETTANLITLLGGKS
ncbi:hypothetical protein [Burkholderia cenocepacia]|uniref:hypothetical protein n=1 Tax=Burkholderia cenocepacia TaxID=95486 RepID=UPI00196B534A|nr:hypothetical protein [Burkholderia cenocepacia]MBN3506533.1 hypothetical protein [Burkholderia cenocepacia]